MRALHWFRNDLRRADNPALCEAARADDGMAAVLVVDPHLESPGEGATPRARYWAACVDALAEELRERDVPLVVLRGDPATVLPRFAARHHIDRVTWTADYSPYAAQRDEAVRIALESKGVTVRVAKGRVVFEAQELRTKTGGAYSVYSPYARRWRERLDQADIDVLRAPVLQGLTDLDGATVWTVPSAGRDDDAGPELPFASSEAAKRRLDTFLDGSVARYAEDRDRPDLDGTSRLSPCLRFGLLSPRQCVERARAAADDDRRKREGVDKWVGELVWRDFYAGLLDEQPGLAKRAMVPAFRDVEWNDDPAGFEAWQAGETGFPIVDAGMRQLARTGWMHNRVRMIVASFLVKDLLIDWRLGERHFFDALFDGDPASNNGGWQWAASTGADAAPYFRIFNPTSQGQRHDPEGDYVRRWVPELEGLEGAAVHEPWDAPLAAGGYPSPIVDHAERRKLALERYGRARDAWAEKDGGR